MSLLCTIAQIAGRNSAELTQGIATCDCTKTGLQDASVSIVKLLKGGGVGMLDASQRDNN